MTKDSFEARIKENLKNIYSPKQTDLIFPELKKLLKGKRLKKGLLAKDLTPKISSSDIALITYANTIEDKKGRKKSLVVLKEFIERYQLGKFLRIVHLLPFYPWDTDRGFSVIDYYRVNPDYGDWKDIEKLSQSVKLMFDFVANHASIKNSLVEKALIERHLSPDDPRYPEYAPYKDFVIAFSDKDKPGEEVLKKLVRPRSTPVLTRYLVYQLEGSKSQAAAAKKTSSNKFQKKLKAILGNEPLKEDKGKLVKILGKGWVWTTFSRPKNPDGSENTRQVDLNYHNPKMFLEGVKILLFYIKKGASLIRLDAIRYLWKRVGSFSVDEKETHLIINLWRLIVSAVASNLTVVAEVNERQSLILPYLGKKTRPEADLVYQFTHFPLAIYSIIHESNHYYLRWLKTLEEFKGRQLITVFGSHDGMGLKPLRGILSEEEIERFADRLVKRGGLPNYAYLPGKKKIVYEVCSTPWHLINGNDETEAFDLKLSRYLLVLALGLSLRGLPAIYINGLFGAKNYYPEEGLDENRTVNREVFGRDELFEELDNQYSHKGRVMRKVFSLLTIRSRESAFDPLGPAVKIVENKSKKAISFVLESEKRDSMVLAVFNLSQTVEPLAIDKKELLGELRENRGVNNQPEFYDLISGEGFRVKKGWLKLKLEPYQVLWLKLKF